MEVYEIGMKKKLASVLSVRYSDLDRVPLHIRPQVMLAVADSQAKGGELGTATYDGCDVYAWNAAKYGDRPLYEALGLAAGRTRRESNRNNLW